MIPAFRAELRKILTVRSTYALTGFFLALVAFLSFYAQGYKSSPSVYNSLYLSGSITQLVNMVSVAGALIALLLMAHEYRYNTMVYTLTLSNSRTKVLAAKVLSVQLFVLVFSLVATGLGLGLMMAGAAASGHNLPHQDINLLTFFAKSVFVCEAYGMIGLLVPTLVRNMQASVAILFIVPNTVEGLLSLLLKKDSVYMPFTALQQVVQAPIMAGKQAAHPETASTGYLSAPRGALVFLAYLVVGWLITWYLFLRRDAA